MWTLLLARAGDPAGAYVDRRHFDGGQLKIGRGARNNDWVLPDERGHLSREHCTIGSTGLDLYVIDTSTNGVFVNAPGSRAIPQQPVPVKIGDRLFLGEYIIDIAPEGAAAHAALMPAAPVAAERLPGGDIWFDKPADPIWDAAGQSQDVHEFLGNAMADFLKPPPQPATPIDIDWNGAMGAAFAKPIMAPMAPPAASDFGIPEDWLAGPAAAQPPLPEPFAPDPFAPARPPPDPFGRDIVASSAAPVAALAPVGAETGIGAFAGNPLAGFDMPAAPPPAAAPVGAPGGDADWAAFCRGAGLAPGDLKLSPQAMERLGVLYRQVVLGLSDLIQDRAAFKDEFRVERTQLSIGRNNPLKHLSPLDTAKLLLADPLPGFMDAEAAVRGALEDIKKHQLAMLAGVQHALVAVFERLAPAEIEKLIVKAAGNRRLPFGRPDPWTVYKTVFEALRVDATNNVNSVMSVAFREGYEAFMQSQK